MPAQYKTSKPFLTKRELQEAVLRSEREQLREAKAIPRKPLPKKRPHKTRLWKKQKQRYFN